MNIAQDQARSSQPATARKQVFLSVVIPAYNEAGNLPSTLQLLREAIQSSPSVGDYEILVIDDHSSDGTFEWVKSLGERRIQCIRLSQRCGSHTAVRAGIALAHGDAALCLSADGQDDPRILGLMLRKLEEGNHIVWGVRTKREEPFLMRILAFAAYRMISLMVNREISRLNVSNADFYLLSRKVVEAINRCPERNTSLFGLLFWIGFKQDYVSYERRSRRSGKSKWDIGSRFRLLVDWIVAFSGIPLRLITFFGMATAALGFLYAAFVIFYTLLGYARSGWAETVVFVLVLGGVQMMMLGILGEYLWRTLDETRSRPLYFIEERTEL